MVRRSLFVVSCAAALMACSSAGDSSSSENVLKSQSAISTATYTVRLLTVNVRTGVITAFFNGSILTFFHTPATQHLFGDINAFPPSPIRNAAIRWNNAVNRFGTGGPTPTATTTATTNSAATTANVTAGSQGSDDADDMSDCGDADGDPTDSEAYDHSKEAKPDKVFLHIAHRIACLGGNMTIVANDDGTIVSMQPTP